MFDSVEAGVAAIGRQGTVGCAVAVSMRLLRDWAVFTDDAGLGADTGGCCFFFNASCKIKKIYFITIYNET